MNQLQEKDFNFNKNTNTSSIEPKFFNLVDFLSISFLSLTASLIFGTLFLFSDINQEQSLQSYKLHQDQELNYINNYQNSNVVDGFTLLLQSYRLMSLTDLDQKGSLNHLFSIFEKIINDNNILTLNKLKIRKEFLIYLDNYYNDEKKICNNNFFICTVSKFSNSKINENQRNLNLIKDKVMQINYLKSFEDLQKISK